jgi:hypothetical protein
MVRAALANSLWWLASRASYATFSSCLQDPDAVQKQVLRSFLQRNGSTAFAREHGISERSTADEFARRVPARSYDELLPWIKRIQQGEKQVLTSDPVTRFVPTSGSSAAHKLIPYTAAMHSELNRGIGPWIFDLFRSRPQLTLGSAYWSISPMSSEAFQFTEQSVVPVGFDDDAAYLGKWRKSLISAIMAVPSELREITIVDDWRYVTALLLLRRRDLRLVSVWHPSFFTLLLQAIHDHWDLLLRDISSGRCAVAKRLPAAVCSALRLSPDSRRARELCHYDPSKPNLLWPQLEVISCWTDANAAGAAAELTRLFGEGVIQPKGLIATEGIISIPFRSVHPLAIRSHYFEFEDDEGSVLRSVRELRVGKEYKVIFTTGGGLWRYRLDDQVIVDGVLGQTPSIRFIGKCSQVSDRVGEKLSDGFVSSVFLQLFDSVGIRPSFAMLAPDIHAGQSAYTLYLNADVPEQTSADLDQLLSNNPHYAYCRRLGQLRAPRLFRVFDDAHTAYCYRIQSLGKRLGDIKPVGLSILDDWSSRLKGHYIEQKT